VRTQEVIELQTTTKFFGMLAALLLFAVIVMPASATQVNIEGGVSPSLSFSIVDNLTVQQFPLVMGVNSKTINTMNAQSNTAWVIKVKDLDAANGKLTASPGAAGRMAYKPSGVWQPNVFLATPLDVGVNGFTPQTTLTAADQIIYTGAGVDTWSHPLSLTQTVLFSDPTSSVVPKYQIALDVTAQATA
jgi:hypothetical protein